MFLIAMWLNPVNKRDVCRNLIDWLAQYEVSSHPFPQEPGKSFKFGPWQTLFVGF
jgi:hypothetical protein